MVRNIKMGKGRPRNKAEIRSLVLEKRSHMTEKERREFSTSICQKVLNFSHYHKAKYLLIFLSHEFEVDTEYIIEQAFKDGKEVYVPRIIDFKAGEMLFIRIYRGNAFEISKQGIREPSLSDEIYKEREDTLCITPGAVFDYNKNRIGYGKGFYDRFFERIKSVKIGICFDLQIIEEKLPTNKRDIPMDYIVSERRML